jgi:hypothetical protein
MSGREQVLQRDGYVAALQHPDIVAAIRSGPRGRIALAYVEWAAAGRQRVVVPWALIDGPRSARAFAQRVAGDAPQSLESTSISSALAFSAGLLARNAYAGDRRVIDISGDGPNNSGLPVQIVRDAVVRRGITINGLAIILRRSGLEIPNLEAYYRDCVAGGEGAFVIRVEGPGSFAGAILRKLTREIAGAPAAETDTVPAAFSAPADCLIGERLGGGAR